MSEEEVKKEEAIEVKTEEENPQPELVEEQPKTQRVRRIKIEHHKQDSNCPECGKLLRKYDLKRHLSQYCKVLRKQKDIPAYTNDEVENTAPPKKQPPVIKKQPPQKERSISPSPKQQEELIDDLLKKFIVSKTEQKNERYKNMMSKFYK